MCGRGRHVWGTTLEKMHLIEFGLLLPVLSLHLLNLHQRHNSRFRLSDFNWEVEERVRARHVILVTFFLCPDLKNFWITLLFCLLFSEYICILLVDFDNWYTWTLTFSELHTKGYDRFPVTNTRCLLLLHWKSFKHASISQWFIDILFFLKLEKINYTLKRWTSKLLIIFTVWRLFPTISFLLIFDYVISLFFLMVLLRLSKVVVLFFLFLPLLFSFFGWSQLDFEIMYNNVYLLINVYFWSKNVYPRVMCIKKEVKCISHLYNLSIHVYKNVCKIEQGWSWLNCISPLFL